MCHMGSQASEPYRIKPPFIELAMLKNSQNSDSPNLHYLLAFIPLKWTIFHSIDKNTLWQRCKELNENESTMKSHINH